MKIAGMYIVRYDNLIDKMMKLLLKLRLYNFLRICFTSSLLVLRIILSYNLSFNEGDCSSSF